MKKVKKWWVLWDERKGQKHILLKRGFDKQPAGKFKVKTDSKKGAACCDWDWIRIEEKLHKWQPLTSHKL